MASPPNQPIPSRNTILFSSFLLQPIFSKKSAISVLKLREFAGHFPKNDKCFSYTEFFNSFRIHSDFHENILQTQG